MADNENEGLEGELEGAGTGAPAGKSAANHLEAMFEDYYLEYASYVNLDRAVPYYEDGLKPVQRRVLHTLREMHDSRFHKVANVIGQTMKYHPHGDASIGDALVNLGQKDLLVDTQGNWGNPATGDRAAAPRYIEGRLTPFAVEVLFNPDTTEWVNSYDGRNQEPVTLPAKFPLALFLGVDGIGVGLATTILPHNFRELCEASIAVLRNKKFELYPDFPGGGIADVSDYQDGMRGGKVRVRAKIDKVDAKTLAIREIPYGTTTGTVIDSIVTANEKGKIKIKKVDDNTSREVEIMIHLHPGTDPQKAIEALYAFTKCQVSLSSNACVIVDRQPQFIGVSEILRRATARTMFLLEWELKNEMEALERKWHMTSLEKIFIENKVYQVIEKAGDKVEMGDMILEGLRPYTKKLRRQVTLDDCFTLAEIPIRRISRFDKKKTDELLAELDQGIARVKDHLEHLVDYTVEWFKGLLKKYGEGRERRAQLSGFENVSKEHVAVANLKLYVNRKEGFIGTGNSLKKEEYLFDVSPYDDLIVFRDDCMFQVVKPSEKAFVGKNIRLVERFNKDDDRRIYNLVYEDVDEGKTMVKRFNVGGITREKDYALGRAEGKCKVLYMSSNANAEAELVQVLLKPRPRTKLDIDLDFSEIEIKGRGALGNTVTKYPVRTVKKMAAGESTMGGTRTLYFDMAAGVVGYARRGEPVGQFGKDDRILVIRKNGHARLFESGEAVLIGQEVHWVGLADMEQVYTVVYFDGGNFGHYVKRFTLEGAPTTVEFALVTEHKDTAFEDFLPDDKPRLVLEYTQPGSREVLREILKLDDVGDIKGFKALGNRLTSKKVKRLSRVPDPEQASSSGRGPKGQELDLFGK